MFGNLKVKCPLTDLIILWLHVIIAISLFYTVKDIFNKIGYNKRLCQNLKIFFFHILSWSKLTENEFIKLLKPKEWLVKGKAKNSFYRNSIKPNCLSKHHLYWTGKASNIKLNSRTTLIEGSTSTFSMTILKQTLIKVQLNLITSKC